MRAVIYFLAGVALVAAAACAIAYGSGNLQTLSESGVAQEASAPTAAPNGSYGQIGISEDALACDEGAISRSYGSDAQDDDGCTSP